MVKKFLCIAFERPVLEHSLIHRLSGFIKMYTFISTKLFASIPNMNIFSHLDN